jgi:hypothetical protein
MKITIPELALVVLTRLSGSGGSTWVYTSTVIGRKFGPDGARF